MIIDLFPLRSQPAIGKSSIQTLRLLCQSFENVWATSSDLIAVNPQSDYPSGPNQN